MMRIVLSWHMRQKDQGHIRTKRQIIIYTTSMVPNPGPQSACDWLQTTDPGNQLWLGQEQLKNKQDNRPLGPGLGTAVLHEGYFIDAT